MSKPESVRPASPGPSDAAILFFIFLAAFALRAWALYARAIVDYDEIYYYILGHNLMSGRGYALNGLPHTAFPPLYPLLVGAVTLITDNIRLATSSVSCLAGALLPLPVFALARDVYGRRIGLVAAALAAVWPAAFFFSAAGVPYAQRMYFGSEPLYVTLLVSGILFAWKLYHTPALSNAVLAGVFFGLASLVRSEGPVVFSFVYLFLVVGFSSARRLWKPRSLAHLAVVAVVMMAVFSPFLIYVHSVTGRWTLGAKLANSVNIRKTLWNWIQLDSRDAFYKTHYRLNSDATEMADPYWGVSPWHRAAMADKGSLSSGFSLAKDPDWRWLPFFFRAFYAGPHPLAPLYMWPFVILGVLLFPWNRRRLKWWAFCLFNFLPMALLAVSLYVLPRHELPLLVFFAIAAARGVDAFARFAAFMTSVLARSLRMEPFVYIAAICLAAVALAISGVSDNIAGNAPGAVAAVLSTSNDHFFADELASDLPQGSLLMSDKPWLALWAGLDWRVAPSASTADILRYARSRNIDYAVLGAWQDGRPEPSSPLYPYFARELTTQGETLYLYDFTRGR